MPADIHPRGRTLNQLMRAPDFYIPTTQEVVESEPVAEVASTLACVAITQDHALNGIHHVHHRLSGHQAA